MATENKKSDDLMEIFIPRAAGKDEPNLMVGINGVNYLLPKGKSSKVPKAVYDEIIRARNAEAQMDETIGKLKDAAKQPK